MYKFRISSGVKTAIVILNEIFAMLLIAVLIMTKNYGVHSGSWEDLLSHRSYEDSDYFQTQSVNQANRAIRAAARATRFESDGVYDPDRFVNISAYAERGIITGEYDSEGLYYRLADLLNWAQSGWDYSELEIDSEGYMSFAAGTSESAQKLNEDLESYFLTSDSEWNSYYQYYQNINHSYEEISESNVYRKKILNERYQPENYRSIVAYAEDSGNNLSTLYAQMETTLSNIVSDVLSYRENENIFSMEESNVRFFLIDREEAQVYTNVNAYEAASEEEIAEYIKGFHSYCIYDNQVLSVNAKKINLSVTDLYGYIEKYGMSGSSNYVLAVAVDTDYPADDIFRQGYENYQRLQPVALVTMAAGILGIAGYFITWLILTMRAGIEPEKEGIVLNWFDHWKTEISCLGLLLTAMAGYIPIRLLDEYFSFLTHEGIVAFVALGENLLILGGWLSLIRRAKAKLLWKNSLLADLIGMIQKFFGNSRRTTKVLYLFLAYLLLNVLLCQFGSFGVILLLCFNAAVGGFLMKEAIQDQKLLDGMKKLEEGDLEYQFDPDEFDNFRKEFAGAVNGIHEVFLTSVTESMKNERMQTDLITNVSHDIKTPLTSIINYVELLKRENIENERARGYIDILEQKSYRLKHLTEDLVEASRISSGNIELEMTQIEMREMLYQAGGEFADKFEEKGLQLIENMAQEPLYIRADGRRLWRVLENLFQNVSKYAMPDTRVYVDLLDMGTEVRLSIKNISKQRLNIAAKDLTERFIRGDISRSTEGSGLGLSIAKNLTELQGGSFDIYLDGDLFRVTITFPKLEALPEELNIVGLEEKIEENLLEKESEVE